MDRFLYDTKKSRFFGKVLSPSDLLNLGGPAGGKRNRDHLCDRLASEQFSYLDQMISYPEIYSPCLSMRLINILIEGNIFSSHRKVEIFEKFRIFWKTN